MQIGDLVTVVSLGVGVIVETDFDEDNGETMFKVAFFNAQWPYKHAWFYDGYMDKLEVTNEDR